MHSAGKGPKTTVSLASIKNLEEDCISPRDSSRHGLNSARTQSAILEAALVTFSQYGLKGASIRDIAKLAGVQHALIRYHFKTKEDLWKSTVHYLFARVRDEVSLTAEEVAQHTPLNIFRIWLRRYISYCARRPEHARLLMQESVEGGPLLEWSVNNFVRHNFMTSKSMLAGLQASGHVRDANLDSLCSIVAAACQTVFVLAHQFKVLTGRDPCSEAFIEEHARVIESLILVQPVSSFQL
jgi:TetR/AcrR family transcriptional regulator